MKGLIFSLSIACASVAMTSCDETARLAKEMPGSWAGTPENFTDNSAVTATTIETYDFEANPASVAQGRRGGDIQITGMLSASTQVLGEAGLVEPLSLTVSGRSVISGTWTVIDDDEVAVNLDISTLDVSIDPETVVANGIVSDMNAPHLDSIKPSVASSIAQSLRVALSNRYSMIRQLDDVKIKEPLMKFEIGDTDYVFTRQGEAR